MARPSIYTPALATEICKRLADGESLRSICRDPDGVFPNRATVIEWVTIDREGFASQYARARDIGLDVMAERALEIAATPAKAYKVKRTRVVGAVATDGDDDPELGTEIESTSGDAVDRSKLHVDTLKWYLSKLAPKRYGDKIQVEHSGNVSIEDRLRAGRARVAGSGE
jgi:hypothetical protein